MTKHGPVSPSVSLRVYRLWFSHAGALTLALLALGGLATAVSSALANALFLLAVLSFAQGLRRLWAFSAVIGVLIAVGVPVAVVAGPLIAEGPNLSMLLLFAPTAAAIVMELIERRLRVANGLPAVEVSAPPPASAARGGGVGVAIAGLLLGLGALSVFVINQPAREARAFHAAIRPGMSLGEVVAATRPYRRLYVSVHGAEGAPPVSIQGSSSATIGSESAQGESEVIALLDRHAPGLGLQSASFTFRGMAPASAVVIVRFGPAARVARAEAPTYHAN